jgi:hypothetical protein
MRISAYVVPTAKAAALLMAILFGVACTHASAHLKVDAPGLVAFEKPDIDEITGIDSSEEPAPAEKGSAQNPQQAPRK